MKFARNKLAKEITRRLDNGEPGDQLAREVAALLIDSGQLSALNSLLRDIQEIRAEQNGIIELTATSAFPLNTEQKNEIEAVVKTHYPNARQIIIHQDRDPNVVGGVSLSFANANMDLTVRAKLNQLRTLTT